MLAIPVTTSHHMFGVSISLTLLSTVTGWGIYLEDPKSLKAKTPFAGICRKPISLEFTEAMETCEGVPRSILSDEFSMYKVRTCKFP